MNKPTNYIDIYHSAWGTFRVDQQSPEFQALVQRVKDGQRERGESEECPCCGTIKEYKYTDFTHDAKKAMDELEVMCMRLYYGKDT